MKGISILVLMLTGIVLLSCQKEFTIEDDFDPPVDSTNTTLSDSIYIESIVELDSTSATDQDTVYIVRYQYDVAKRVAAKRTYWDDGGGLALMDEQLYTYNGTDTLPASSKLYTYDFIGGGAYHKDTTTIWYTYSSGKLVKDSSIYISEHASTSPTDTIVTTYNYTPLQVTSSRFARTGNRFDPSDYDVYITKDVAVLDSRGNVISSKEYETFVISSKEYETFDGGATWDLLNTTDFTYDTKPSPFSRLSNFKTLQVVAPAEAWYDEMQTPNNRISSRFDGGGFVNTTTFSGFIYNANEKLLSFRLIEPGVSPQLVVKFFYRSL